MDRDVAVVQGVASQNWLPHSYNKRRWGGEKDILKKGDNYKDRKKILIGKQIFNLA